MTKGIRLFFNELNEIIDRCFKNYRINIFTLIAAFIILNSVGGVILNIHQNTENLKDNYKVSIYLKGSPDEKVLNGLEEKLLELPEVKYLKYESKEVELRELEDDLGIRLPKGNNPLSDSISLTFDGYNNLDKLQEKLDEEDNLIKEVYIDRDNLELLNKRIIKNETLIRYFFVGAFFPVLFILFNLFHMNILNHRSDISTKIYLGGARKTVLKPYYFISDIIFVVSALVGTLIFLNIYELFRNEFINYERDYILASTEEMLVLAVITTLIIVVIFPMLSRMIYKVKGENK
jgi:cell division transport system permease protein